MNRYAGSNNHRMRWVLTACILSLLFARLAGHTVLAQGAVPSAERSVPAPLEGVVLERLIHPKNRFDWYAAYQELSSFTRDDKLRTLHQVITYADEEYGGLIADNMIAQREYSDQSLARIVDKLDSWNEGTLLRLLVAVRMANSKDDLLVIPRRILANAVKSDTNPDAGDAKGRGTSVDKAAALLALGGEDSDLELIGRVVEHHPLCKGCWLALAMHGLETETGRTNARSTWQDATNSLFVRLAAAAALSPGDPDATEFVRAQLKGFLDRYCGASLETLFPDLHEDHSEESRKAYAEFRNDIGILATLRFLNTEVAEPIVLEYLNTPNQTINEILGLIAVIRWPTDFLTKASHERFTGDRALLFAAVVHYHPQLAEAVVKRISPETLRDGLARLKVHAVSTVFGMAAPIVDGW